MQLTADISATGRYLDLDEAYLPAARFSYIQVEDERMFVASGEGTMRIRVRRGVAGTAKATHAQGTTVTPVGGGSHTHAQYLSGSTPIEE
jgi:hypothetical protein